MTADIPASTLDLFEKPVICALSTINPDGQPHTVPVWCDFDGTNVRVNSPDAARKARNMSIGSKVTVMLVDPTNAFHWVEVMGHVVEIRDEASGARAHINALAKKYIGQDVYQDRPGVSTTRLMYLIQPDKVHGR